jgi:hypothetical protein
MTGASRQLATLVAGFGAAATILWACSGSSPKGASGSSCGGDPTECTSGTTCWPATASADLECLPSHASGTFGVACFQTVGSPTCADGLGCDQTGPDGGVCTYYCGGSRSCPAGYDCRQTEVGGSGGPSVDVCRVLTDAGVDSANADGGAHDGAPGSDAEWVTPVEFDSGISPVPSYRQARGTRD